MYRNFCNLRAIINGYEDFDCSYNFKLYTDFRKLAIICDQEEQIDIALKKGVYDKFQIYYKQLFEYSDGKHISKNDLSDRLEKLNELIDIDELIEHMQESIIDNIIKSDYIDEFENPESARLILSQICGTFVLHSLSNWMYDTISGNSDCFIEKYSKEQIELIPEIIFDTEILKLMTYETKLIKIENDEYNAKLIRPKNKQRRNG